MQTKKLKKANVEYFTSIYNKVFSYIDAWLVKHNNTTLTKLLSNGIWLDVTDIDFSDIDFSDISNDSKYMTTTVDNESKHLVIKGANFEYNFPLNRIDLRNCPLTNLIKSCKETRTNVSIKGNKTKVTEPSNFLSLPSIEGKKTYTNNKRGESISYSFNLERRTRIAQLRITKLYLECAQNNHKSTLLLPDTKVMTKKEIAGRSDLVNTYLYEMKYLAEYYQETLETNEEVFQERRDAYALESYPYCSKAELADYEKVYLYAFIRENKLLDYDFEGITAQYMYQIFRLLKEHDVNILNFLNEELKEIESSLESFKLKRGNGYRKLKVTEEVMLEFYKKEYYKLTILQNIIKNNDLLITLILKGKSLI